MVAVLLVAAIERDQEQVRAGETYQDLRRTLPLEDRVAERARESIEDRGTGQEVEIRSRQAGEELVAQVIGDEAVVTVEALDRQADVVLSLERERREIDPDGPALGVLEEALDILRLHRETDLLEHGRRLAQRHRKIVCVQLDQQAASPQASDWELGLLAGGDRER